MLINLPIIPLSRIIGFLDRRSYLCLSKVMPRVKAITAERERCERIARYILENYTIVASSKHVSDLHAILLEPIHFIALGERHVIRQHRLLNASLVALMWKQGYQLNIEGGKECLTPNDGMLEYLPAEITAQADTWDLDAVFDLQGCSIAGRLVNLAQNFYHYLESDRSYPSLYNHLSACCSAEVIKLLHQQFPELDVLKNWKNRSEEMRKLQQKVVHRLLNFFIDNFTQEILSWQKNSKINFDNRNVAFLSKMKEGLNAQKKVIHLAGQGHLNDQKVITGMKSLKRIIPFAFLTLVPKPHITENSVNASFKRCFGTPLPAHFFKKPLKQKRPAAAIQPDLQQLMKMAKNGIQLLIKKTSVDRIEEEIDFDELQASLMQVTQIDCNKNHFGAWSSVSLFFLMFLSAQQNDPRSARLSHRNHAKKARIKI